MPNVVVRYQTKPECADENQALVEAVFADLEARKTAGFTYQSLRLEDGVSFVHDVQPILKLSKSSATCVASRCARRGAAS